MLSHDATLQIPQLKEHKDKVKPIFLYYKVDFCFLACCGVVSLLHASPCNVSRKHGPQRREGSCPVPTCTTCNGHVLRKSKKNPHLQYSGRLYSQQNRAHALAGARSHMIVDSLDRKSTQKGALKKTIEGVNGPEIQKLCDSV